MLHSALNQISNISNVEVLRVKVLELINQGWDSDHPEEFVRLYEILEKWRTEGKLPEEDKNGLKSYRKV